MKEYPVAQKGDVVRNGTVSMEVTNETILSVTRNREVLNPS